MKRIFIGVACVALLAVSWLTIAMSKSDAQKQLELMEQASAYIDDKVYVLAEPILEEAASYDEAYTLEAEEALKNVYLELLDESGYARKYTALLEKQMSRDDASAAVFEEAANYYLRISKVTEALNVLKDGIERTANEELIKLYEDNRYQYGLNQSTYQNVTEICNGAIQVEQDGYWGLALADGTLKIPCKFEKVSTYSGSRAIVRQDNEIFAVNSSGLRIALLHEDALDFGNLGDDLVPIQLQSGWVRANSDLNVGSACFEELGMYSNGYAAAKQNGKWGVIDSSAEWIIPAEYDGIIQDELGRCYSQDAVFVRQGDQVLLLVNGAQVGEVYEDAYPFNGGLAAVKKNGLWGFIDTDGAVQIDYQFEDARSFGQHLAAVMVDGFWGYISLDGSVVIEPIFLGAKNFYDGSAPVQTEEGWRFITLLEYKET